MHMSSTVRPNDCGNGEAPINYQRLLSDFVAKSYQVIHRLGRISAAETHRQRGLQISFLVASPDSVITSKLARVGVSIAPTGIQPYSDCGRRHLGECWRRIGACLRCGSLDHRIRDCLQRRVPGRGASKTGVRQPALAYIAQRREDKDAPNVITGTFLISNVPYTALIDIGSTHSYVASTVFENLGVAVESTSRGITVLSPLGQSIWVSKIYRDVPLEVQGIVFLVDLMELSFGEFDLILETGSERVWAYLAYVSVSGSRDSSDGNIRTVRDFLDVFPKELLGLPLNREVEFGIELLPSTTLVSIAPYRMAPKELIELKAQLQELLDRGFIHPNEWFNSIIVPDVYPKRRKTSIGKS
ncbi:hypothetical protein EPI10_021203 [Gossypium australe]|uniref:RVP_2 domain-containing protein n=1 Tax=Gossypium australe TaxID=47621 RepID=A0A5B6WGL3_9ROSI|nr:hypothetical protein EPI10_021203 [Gossypium australe]